MQAEAATYAHSGADLGALALTAEGLVLRKRAPGMSAEEVANATGAPLIWISSVPEIKA